MITTKQIDAFFRMVSLIIAIVPLLIAFIIGVLVIRPLAMVADVLWQAFKEGWEL